MFYITLLAKTFEYGDAIFVLGMVFFSQTFSKKFLFIFEHVFLDLLKG